MTTNIYILMGLCVCCQSDDGVDAPDIDDGMSELDQMLAYITEMFEHENHVDALISLNVFYCRYACRRGLTNKTINPYESFQLCYQITLCIRLLDAMPPNVFVRMDSAVGGYIGLRKRINVIIYGGGESRTDGHGNPRATGGSCGAVR